MQQPPWSSSFWRESYYPLPPATRKNHWRFGWAQRFPLCCLPSIRFGWNRLLGRLSAQICFLVFFSLYFFSVPSLLGKRKIPLWKVLVGPSSFPLRDSFKINPRFPPRSSSAAGYLPAETAWRKQWLVERDHEGCLLGKAALCVAVGSRCGSNVFFSLGYR